MCARTPTHKHTVTQSAHLLQTAGLFLSILSAELLQRILESGKRSNWPIKRRYIQLVNHFGVCCCQTALKRSKIWKHTWILAMISIHCLYTENKFGTELITSKKSSCCEWKLRKCCFRKLLLTYFHTHIGSVIITLGAFNLLDIDILFKENLFLLVIRCRKLWHVLTQRQRRYTHRQPTAQTQKNNMDLYTDHTVQMCMNSKVLLF